MQEAWAGAGTLPISEFPCDPDAAVPGPHFEWPELNLSPPGNSSSVIGDWPGGLFSVHGVGLPSIVAHLCEADQRLCITGLKLGKPLPLRKALGFLTVTENVLTPECLQRISGGRRGASDVGTAGHTVRPPRKGLNL